MENKLSKLSCEKITIHIDSEMVDTLHDDKVLFLDELIQAIDQSKSEGNFDAINLCIENWEDTIELLNIPGLKDRAWAQFDELKEAGCIRLNMEKFIIDKESSKIKDKLLKLFKQYSINNKLVTLSSCKKSTIYIDAHMIDTLPQGAPLIAYILKEMIGNIDVVGGPVISAIPLLGALSGNGYYKTFFIRKTMKEHGLTKQIEGQINKNDKTAAIIDDVATSGNSLISAINQVKKQYPNINIKKVIVLVDREEGATKKLKEYGYTLESIFKKDDIINKNTN